MTKYKRLEDYLQKQEREYFTLTISEIETILGFELTQNQKKERSNWYGAGSWVIGDAFAKCGFKATPDLEHGIIIVKRTIVDKPKEHTAFNITFKTRKSQRLSLESLLLKDRGMETDEYFADFVNDNRFLLADKNEAITYFKNVIAEAKEKNVGRRSSTYRRMILFSERALTTIETARVDDVKIAQKVFYESLFPNKDKDFVEFVNEIPQRMSEMKSDYDFTYSWCLPRFSDSYLEKRDDQLRRNYEINIKHFESLDKNDFNKCISMFIVETEKLFNNSECRFFEVFDLNNEILEKSGYYVLILDEYKQVYIGRASNVKRRIVDHWTRILPYNQRLFGEVETSKLSIDSFGSEDVTRIFVKIDCNAMNVFLTREDQFINLFPNKYTSNRINGGLPGWDVDIKSMAKKLNDK